MKSFGAWPPSRGWGVAFLTLSLCGAAAMLLTGPHLGDHEVIVAQTARQMLQTGHWIIPEYLDTPFLVKPPLAAWLVAAASAVLPGMNGLPVSDISARLPSLLAVALTVLVVWKLAGSIFTRRIASVAAFLAATCLGMLLFAVNATAEALLMFCCTWAFAEFWWATNAGGSRSPRRHLAAFYIALGLGMLAKGPMPLPMVALPLAAWWFLDHGRIPRSEFRIRHSLFRNPLSAARDSIAAAVRRLGLWWGVPLFLLVFLPWMIVVARHEPYAWELWNYEFLDRARGKYPGCRWGEFHYYLPIFFGMMLPWSLSVPEALAAPFMRAYARWRRPLVYVFCWVVVPLLFATSMSFKKPYYILPVLPGCILLLAPVIDRFFFENVIVSRLRARFAVGIAIGALAAIPIVGWFLLPRLYPEEWHGAVVVMGVVISALTVFFMALAAHWYVRSQRTRSLTTVGMTCFFAFITAWGFMGPALGNSDDPVELVEELRQTAPADAALYWASNRPDGRVAYYGMYPLRQVVDPYRLIAEHRKRATADEMRMIAAGRILELLKGDAPVCLVMQREDFEMLMAFVKPPARELFSIDRGDIGPDKEDWVVVTNDGAERAHLAYVAPDLRPSS